MAAPSSTLPLGFKPPLTVNNDVNHNGLIAVITSFSLFLVLGSLGIRVYSAYNRKARQMDDPTFTATVNQVIALAQMTTVFVQIHFGWGKTTSLIADQDLIPMKKVSNLILRVNQGISIDLLSFQAGYSADILYVTILPLSKISTLVFYRVITMRSLQWMAFTVLALVTLWTPVGVILLAIRCNGDPWGDITSRRCPALFPRWQAITAIDIVLEVMLVLYPVRVISRLQTSLNKKTIVLVILSCRVQINSTTPSLEGSIATIMAELHIALSVLVLTAPLMKPFLAAYVDEDGLAYTDDSLKTRSPASSRSRRLKILRLSTTRDSETLNPDDTIHATVGSGNILKSVQISVDREAVELPDRNAS
ncbi:hypothetical protein NUU61_005923 [Penicillium alfredii]|uniref:Rhodopsin domain-containing protein n=1 Tax=Penicillium alfredii TaxID=1506179 RepID=A0A9W9F002_9EURO|nr:uncharacterized protein NUU61_005923 [Penicillium alfredii]KAJ5091053.1 hypothetical protein NUU61_005923 [Penicillium alfredii]